MFIKKKYRQQLDATNEIITQIDILEDYTLIRGFSVIYVNYSGEMKIEIIKFDVNQKEEFHIHHYYYKEEVKKYLQKPINWETIDECIEQIQRHWRWYLSQYRENHYI